MNKSRKISKYPNEGVFEAPSDGKEYVRKDKDWHESTGDGIPDAPSDGTAYSRLDGSWTNIVDWNAIQSIPENVSNALSKSGGTMSGQAKGITPIDDEDLTRKDYVDNLIVDSTISIVAGTSMVAGALSINGQILTVTDGAFLYTDGINPNGYVLSSQYIASEPIDFTADSDGRYWLYRNEQGVYTKIDQDAEVYGSPTFNPLLGYFEFSPNVAQSIIPIRVDKTAGVISISQSKTSGISALSMLIDTTLQIGSGVDGSGSLTIKGSGVAPSLYTVMRNEAHTLVGRIGHHSSGDIVLQAFTGGSISEQLYIHPAGNVSIQALAPTLPAHLTRKDYVDTLLASMSQVIQVLENKIIALENP